MWRIQRAFSFRQFPGREAFEIMSHGRTDRIVVGQRGLDQDVATQLPSPCSAGDLTQKLKRPLARPEVRQMNADICVHDSHQGDAREVESLGDHLCPEQDVDVAPLHTVEDALVSPLSGGRVHVHARDTRVGKGLRGDALDLLGTKTPVGEVR